MQIEQRGKRVGPNQRAVAAEDECVGRCGVLLDVRLRHHHGVPCAKLLGLQREFDILHPSEGFAHEFGAVPDHEHDLGRTRSARGVDHPVHHRATNRWVHDLRQVRLHARALASRENDGDKATTSIRVGSRSVRVVGVGHLGTHHLDEFGRERKCTLTCAIRRVTASELARLDSNQDKVDQNHLCYRYTTGHSAALPQFLTFSALAR